MDDDAQPETPPVRPGAFTRRGALVVTVVFLALVVVPGALLIGGQRAVNLEGATPSTLPRYTPRRVLDAATYTRISNWFADAMPLRDNAITVNAALSVNVLHDSTTPKVVLGSHGWYYTSDDATLAACVPYTQKADELRANVERLHTAATRAQVRLVVAISPDKTPIELANFPSANRTRGCILDYDTAMRRAFATRAPSWLPDLWSVVRQVRDQHGTAFYRTDSHLNPTARVAEAKAVIDAIQPGLWTDDVVVDGGTRRRETDLARQLGLHVLEPQRYYDVRRKGVRTTPAQTVVGTDREKQVRSFVRYRSTGGPMVEGRTVILHDSQFELASADLIGWFADVTFVHWDTWGDPRIAALLAQADTVIVETVQRATWQRLGAPLPILFEKVYGKG